MNALNPLAPDKRGADRKTYEPSMEEILASIRRIIADDQAFSIRQTASEAGAETDAAAALAPESAAEPVPQRRRPSLGEAVPEARMTAPEAAAPSLAIESEPPLPAPPPRPPAPMAPFPVEAQFPFFKAAAVPRAAEPGPAETARVEQPRSESVGAAKATFWPQPPERVIANRPAQSSGESGAEALPLVSSATDASVSSSFNALIASQFLQSGDVVNDMVREMLRPMLKAWLDDNLPVLVERLVRAEIERVARGGR